MTYHRKDKTMFKGLGEHNLNRRAVDIIYQTLPGALRMTDFVGQAASFNILWEKRRLCVRVARQSRAARFPRWVFALSTVNKEKVDFFIFIALTDNKIHKLFVVPASITPQITVSITESVGFVRYGMFETSLGKVGEKIEEIEARLPELEAAYKAVKAK